MSRRRSGPRWPCPCCGHLTLPHGPGDYELCPVCFWEDDAGQLCFPLSDDGANGISLLEAQGHYARLGACDPDATHQVRPPAPDEPRADGWRPLDLARDDVPGQSTARAVPWPADAQRLYWWRPDYYRLPGAEPQPAPRARLDGDSAAERLMARVVAQVPESQRIEDRLRAGDQALQPFGFVSELPELAFEAVERGEHELLDRLVAVLETGLADPDPEAQTCVAIGFFEHEGWVDPALEELIARWPPLMRAEVTRRRTYATSLRGRLRDPSAWWRHPLWRWRHRVRGDDSAVR